MRSVLTNTLVISHLLYKQFKVAFTIIILVSTTLFTTSCSNKKSTVATEEEKILKETQKVEISSRTKLFLEELNDFKSADQVSEDFKSKYSIKELEGINYVSGTLTYNSAFAEKSITELGVKTNLNMNNRLNVLVPLKAIDDFLAVEGIEYFEIATKGNLK